MDYIKCISIQLNSGNSLNDCRSTLKGWEYLKLRRTWSLYNCSYYFINSLSYSNRGNVGCKQICYPMIILDYMQVIKKGITNYLKMGKLPNPVL